MRPLVCCCLLALTACPKRVPSPAAYLEQAALDAADPEATAREIALAGFHAYLLGADVTGAQARFDQALAADPSDPFALYGQLLLARRRGHPERGLIAALDLCERAPHHPLAVAAARYALDFQGVAVPLDDLILQRSQAALAAGLRGDASQLLRSAVASIALQRGDDARHAELLSQMGVPTTYSLWGPFSPQHLLSFDEATPPERDGSLAGPFQGPFGAVQPRQVTFPDGRFSLAGEPPDADAYLLAVDFEAPERAVYVVRTVTASAHRAILDQTVLFSRRTFERASSTVSARAVQLEPGRHRLLLRLTKGDRSGSIGVGVMRADGQPSNLKFSPAFGPAAAWAGATPVDALQTYPAAEDLAQALLPEAGELLSEYLAAQDGWGRDRDGAKRLAASLAKTVKAPALTALRAELSIGDFTVPSKVARGRAARDLEATLEADRTNVAALLSSASLALEDSRNLEASELVKRARAAHRPVGFPVLLAQARVELALGIDAQADLTAKEALEVQPQLCEALGLRYDLARRKDAVAAADGLLEALQRCPGALSRSAEHAKARGDVKTAAERYQRLVARDPGHLAESNQLSQVYLSQRRFGEAIALLERMLAQWPRSAPLLKRLADFQELAGKHSEALATRKAALAIDGGDLSLHRQIERARTGKEPLEELAIDGKAALAAYQAKPGTEDSPSAYVLDAAAVRAYPDGSTVDRIHIIQKALDQSGVSDVAEVAIPAGAYVLALRTIKADGAVLEPESIEGKETISLPGVQVGDYVEYEYLQAHPSRGPSQPGFTSASFYFQISRQPNNWSTYKVVAPKGTGLAVDGHQTGPLKIDTAGAEEVFSHEQRNVPPYIPEPNGPPSPNEYLPFVTVGAGTTGNEALVAAYADAFLDRGQLTFEVEDFARQATEGKTGLDAVRALYEQVMKKLSGRDAGLTASAASAISQDRGSRLWALKAGLEAIGLRTRIAAVRTFAADPAPYRFPNESLLPYLCLRVELPEGGQVWLDVLVRFAPFGELPELALGGREAYLLPEPGRPTERVKTPPLTERPPKDVRLELKLGADGKLTGSGTEIYTGFEAAQLAEALEALSPDQRTQALESALARYFGGADLSGLELDLVREVGAPLTVRYKFSAPRFGRLEGEKKMVLGALTFPFQLGRRFVQTGSRRTPLFIEGTEATHLTARVELPPGFELVGPLAEVKAAGTGFGKFLRTEKQRGAVLTVEEDFRLDQARVPTNRYQAFAQFAGEVDLIQTRDLLIQKR